MHIMWQTFSNFLIIYQMTETIRKYCSISQILLLSPQNTQNPFFLKQGINKSEAIVELSGTLCTLLLVYFRAE